MFAPDLKNDLGRGLREGFDVLHLEGLWSGWLGLRESQHALINVHNLLSIDVQSAPARTPAERIRRLATRAAERRILRSYPLVCTLTERLSDEIRKMAPDSTVVTNPLPLDFTHYPWEPHSDDRSHPVVTLIGSFRWQPTYSAAHRLLTRLWPAIRQRIPDARLQIVGRDARTMLREFIDESNVAIHEDVPEIRPYFAAADAMLYAPAPATGMKVKVLEAFALGLPVVTTPDGVEGIGALDGVHAGVATEDADLVERTVALLRDPELRAERRLAARQLVESTCDPRAALDRLADIYSMVGRRRAT
jgi:glycosyltransferase involved in cell wall biosynthesis